MQESIPQWEQSIRVSLPFVAWLTITLSIAYTVAVLVSVTRK